MNIFTRVLGWVSTIEHRTHDMIVSPLQSIVDELHDYAAHHATQQIVKNAAIDQLKDEVDMHEAEAAKAVATATRLGGIIG